MGLLVEGKWQAKEETPSISFIRTASEFRNWITADGSSGFKAEPGRYHLYISLACPWASRALIFRRLKKLEDIISLSIVDPIMLDNGWEFSENTGCIPDAANHKQFLHEVYSLAAPNYTGRVTVPVLWDKVTKTIVNNESADIIRMFNSEFNAITKDISDFYPEELRAEIDKTNDYVYNSINNGVYKCGFATRQDAYESAFDALFEALDVLEDHFTEHDYLVGEQITEADWRLFTTLIRFDSVYNLLYKCNKFRIIDYENLHEYLLGLYGYPGIAETVNMDHIKRHYYISQMRLNPNQIVPKGPDYI
ncbi:MAG: glutathione S-transferase family protein [Pseudomonadota bacterium]|nr:glutathione S-transferase family protein [Pseudomonadota bacterium]